MTAETVSDLRENGVRRRPLQQRDTIAAISTPPGEGAIALVRLSGERAVAVAERIFRGNGRPAAFRSHLQHFGEIFFDGEIIDQVMLSVHRAPHSYTGDDLVEISCHGGMLVTARVLGACFQTGARPARPGEFTERAYLNGKIDLTQAEAVIDLIRANTDLALRAATEQLEGKLGERFEQIRAELISTLAQIDAAIDFPDEGIGGDTVEQLVARVEQTRAAVQNLLATARSGRIIREGVRVVIFGPTNAGKSSLLNRFLGYERAIVSEIHGTTRDTIEEVVNLRGVAVRLRDTAGIRDTADQLEREGLMRTQKALESADLRLLVIDASAPEPDELQSWRDNLRVVLDPEERNGARPSDRPLVVLNKSDLAEHRDWKATNAIRVSCTTGSGFDELERGILSQIGMDKLQPDTALAVNARHSDCLRRAADALDRAAATLRGDATLETAAVDLREAQRATEEVIGASDDEAVRDAIFAQFCIGK